MITPKSIDHICLTSSNLEKTKNHYQKIFDFHFSAHPNAPKTLILESEKVHFFIQEKKLPKEFLSEQHISLEIENIKEIKKKLNQLKISYTSGTFNKFKYRNYHWIEWRDHDQVRIECVETF